MTDDESMTVAGAMPKSAARDQAVSSLDTSTRSAFFFWVVWHGCTALLVLSLLSSAYGALWEFSTERYLKGFSDAIVPANSAPVGKIQAILTWMSEPAALDTSASSVGQDRDPEDTLNYSSLLEVCGTATNAFINLADSAGLSSRRLLLLDSHGTTMHVVAEVLVDGRWIVVDPVFRHIPRRPDGSLLTRKQLADPVVFSQAMQNIRNYDPAYNYQHTTHVHLARLSYLGRIVRRIFNALVPGWAHSPKTSLLLERSSLAFFMFSATLFFFALCVRFALRWYAAARLHIRLPHLHRRVASACVNFFNMAP